MSKLFDDLKSAISRSSLDAAFPAIYGILANNKSDDRNPDLTPTDPHEYFQIMNTEISNGESLVIPMTMNQDGILGIVGFSSSENVILTVTHGDDVLERVGMQREGRMAAGFFRAIDPTNDDQPLTITVSAPEGETLGPVAAFFATEDMPIEQVSDFMWNIDDKKETSPLVIDEGVEGARMIHMSIWDGNSAHGYPEAKPGDEHEILAKGYMYSGEEVNYRIVSESWTELENGDIYYDGSLPVTCDFVFDEPLYGDVYFEFDLEFDADTPNSAKAVYVASVTTDGIAHIYSVPYKTDGHVLRTSGYSNGVYSVRINSNNRGKCTVRNVKISNGDRSAVFSIGQSTKDAYDGQSLTYYLSWPFPSLTVGAQMKKYPRP